MAGVGKFYFVLSEAVAGISRIIRGSTLKPVSPFATTGGRVSVVQHTIAAGASETVYDYSVTNNGFDLLTIECDGYVDVAIKGDKATSSTDRTALGTHVGWNHVGCSCNAPLVLPGDDLLVNDTGSELVGNAFHADNVAGKVYQIQVKNPGTSAVTVTVTSID